MLSIIKSRWLLIGLCAFSLCVGAVLTYDLVMELVTGADPVGPFSTHNDFLAFYTAAQFILHGNAAALYNGALLQKAQFAIVHHPTGAAGYMPFLNPPFAAALLTPLALVSEPVARLIWVSLNSLLAVGLCWYLAGRLRLHHRWLVALVLLGTFPVYENLAEGQLSLLMLAGCCGALALANRQRLFISGLALSVLWLKPQLALLAIALLVLFRAWRVIGGMLAALIGVVAITAPFTGLHAYPNYVAYLGQVLTDHLDGAGAISSAVWKGSLNLTAGINGLFTAIFGQKAPLTVDVFTFLFDGLLLVAYGGALRRIPRSAYANMKPIIIALSVAVVLLVDPHLYQQDVVLAFVLLPILASHIKHPLAALAAITSTNLLILDYLIPWHPFTLLLLGGTVWGCLTVIKRPTGTAQLKPDPA